MKLTKFQHACFVVEEDGAALIVDLGAYTHDFIAPKHVTAIVVTHEHADHFDEARILELLKAHPKATVIAHESISGRFTNYTAIGAKVGEQYIIGPFSLQFFGGTHAEISDSTPVPPNFGVLINNRLYYPGDSFVAPVDHTVNELALPASAPWMKLSEAMHFLAAVHPHFTFPTHDAILSTEGKELADRMLGATASGQNTQYKRLDGYSITLPELTTTDQ